MAKPTTTTTVKPPPDAPNELQQQFAAALAQFQKPDDDSDPPVWQYGTVEPDPYRGTYEPMRTQKSYGLTTKPLSKAILDFYSLDPDELKRFQELAFQAGLYGASAERGDVPFGARDMDTFQIWQTLNKQAAGAAQVGKKNTVWDMLQDLVDHRPENLGKKKKERGPLVNVLPNPTDIKDLVLSSAHQVLGRDPDPAFADDFVAMYQKIVSDFNENKYSLEGTEEGGTITAPPSAEALARFRLKTENPAQFEEVDARKRENQYLQLLKAAL